MKNEPMNSTHPQIQGSSDKFTMKRPLFSSVLNGAFGPTLMDTEFGVAIAEQRNFDVHWVREFGAGDDILMVAVDRQRATTYIGRML